MIAFILILSSVNAICGWIVRIQWQHSAFGFRHCNPLNCLINSQIEFLYFLIVIRHSFYFNENKNKIIKKYRLLWAHMVPLFVSFSVHSFIASHFLCANNQKCKWTRLPLCAQKMANCEQRTTQFNTVIRIHLWLCKAGDIRIFKMCVVLCGLNFLFVGVTEHCT